MFPFAPANEKMLSLLCDLSSGPRLWLRKRRCNVFIHVKSCEVGADVADQPVCFGVLAQGSATCGTHASVRTPLHTLGP